MKRNRLIAIISVHTPLEEDNLTLTGGEGIVGGDYTLTRLDEK